jgi:Resolvase, N terminal domain
VRALTKAGCKKVFCEVASGAKTDRAQLRRLLDQLEAGDVLMVTRLDRLARSGRDLLNTLATITGKKGGSSGHGTSLGPNKYITVECIKIFVLSVHLLNPARKFLTYFCVCLDFP